MVACTVLYCSGEEEELLVDRGVDLGAGDTTGSREGRGGEVTGDWRPGEGVWRLSFPRVQQIHQGRYYCKVGGPNVYVVVQFFVVMTVFLSIFYLYILYLFLVYVSVFLYIFCLFVLVHLFVYTSAGVYFFVYTSAGVYFCV